MILREDNNKKVYSDGETTEARMLKIAKMYPDDAAEEYISNNSEYILNNTFSAVRQNILNWYDFESDAEILEIGAGMGSLTGMLCDKAKHVTALEMSPARAEIIQTRYSNRKNLSVVCENMFEWKTEKKFDYVVFIGVLEYAAIFLNSKSPYEDFLNKAKDFLKENGTLLFAIENQFGLKYWVGGSEDHLQTPFVGLKGYSDKKGPRTFSKKALEDLLDNVGMENHRFYYIYPDYKFPEVIFSDERKPDYRNLQKVSFTYSKNSLLLMNEKCLYKELIENDVWKFFANSFLIEAKKRELDEKHVVHVSAKGEVKKKYRVSTVITSDNYVKKVPMHADACQHISNVYDNTTYLKKRGVNIIDVEKEGNTLVSRIYEGMSAQDYFCQLLQQNNRKEIFQLISTLRREIEKTGDISEEKVIFDGVESSIPFSKLGPILKKGFVDMTFYNSFYDEGKLIFYDQEWCFPNTPINFILYYAISSAYRRAQVETDIELDELWEFLDIKDCITDFSKFEDYVWSKILYRQTDFYGDGGYCNRFTEDNSLESVMKRNSAELECSKQKQVELNLEIDKLNLNIENQREEYTKAKEKFEQRIRHAEEKENNLNNKIQDLKQEVLNKQGHIELLLPVEREYEAVKRSISFRMMRACCRCMDSVLYIPKIVVKKILALIRMLSHVNVPKLKIAAGYVKEEGILEAYRHLMRDYHKGELRKISVDVDEKIYDDIISLEECDTIELPKYENPDVSIIIPAYNQFTYNYYCIESIKKHSGDVKYEVILADDCSNDLTKDIAKVVKNLQIARTEKNMLFLRNCNNAAKFARGKYILFLNNDTQVQENWLKPLVDLIESDTQIGMVGSKLVYADGTLQEAGGIIWKDGSGWNYGRNMDAMAPEYNYVREVDYISGAAIMIRAELWKKLGGFDEHFAPAYCEDSDLAFQVRKAGYKVMYQPLSVVVHFEGKSNGVDTSSGIKKYQIENSMKLKEKWATELEKQYPNAQNVFKARERSKGRKTILVIDHYVPQFDKDAGSKTTFQYLKMFVKQGYVVKFMGDNFYQDEPYTTELQQLGIEVLYGSWYAQHWEEWIVENQKNIDFVYLNRPHISIKYIDFLKEKTNIKCIYYGHDFHYMRLKREAELNGDETKLKEADAWLEKELYIMRKADMNYYPSCIEKDEINKLDSAIPVKDITAYVYESFLETVCEDFVKREGIVFVGGFGHPPNEDAVIWFVENVYPLILQKQEIPFYIVGSHPTEKIKALPKKNKNIILKGFVSEEELYSLYQSCKMAIVPLRYGAGVKGKVVEALYHGIPMVTTSVGSEGIEGIEDIVSVADDQELFSQKVLELYNDNGRLRETQKQYQEFIKENFGIDAVWKKIEEDFE